MQGIKVGLNQESVKKVKKQFNELLKDMQEKAKQNEINIGLNGVNKEVDALKNKLEKLQQTVNGKKLKVINADDVEKEKVKIFRSIDEIKKRYENSGELTFPSILKDSDGNITGVVAQVKQADGVIKQFHHSLVNLAGNGDKLQKVFQLDYIKDIDKTAEIKEKQLQEIQKINTKIIKEEQDRVNKEKKAREDYIAWWTGKAKEIEDRQLKASVADDTRIKSLGTNLTSNGSPSLKFDANPEQITNYVRELTKGKAEISRVTGELIKNGKAVKEVEYRVKEGDDKWHLYKLTLDKTTGGIYNLDKGLKDALNRQVSFGEAIKIAVTRTMQWASAMTVFYGTLRQVKEGIQFINDINKQQTTIKMVTGMGNDEVQDLTKSYADLALQMGDTTKNLMSGSIEWFRQGKNIEETNELIKASAIEARLAGIEASQATTYLTAALNGYQMQSEDVMNIVDKMTAIDNAAATSVSELSEALMHSASSANLAGVSMDKYLAWVGTVSSTTRKSASSIGESFKTIFARFQDIKQGKEFDSDNEPLSNVESSLNKVGITLRKSATEFKDLGGVMDEISKKWNTLNDLQQSDLSKSIAGVRQRENFIALMANYNTALDLEQKAINSSGNAQLRYQEYLKSTEAQLAKLKVEGEKFWLNFLNSGTINSAIQGLTGLVGILDELVNKSRGLGIALVALATAFLLVSKNIKAVGLAQVQASFLSMISTIKLLFTEFGMLVTEMGVLKATSFTLGVGFSALGKAAMGAIVAMATNPLTWIAVAIGGVVALTMHFRKQREEAEKLKKEYGELKTALESIDISGQKMSAETLRGRQSQLDNLVQQRESAKSRIGLSPNADATFESASNKVKEYIEQLQEAGYTVDELNGKIVELGMVESNIANQDAIDNIDKKTQAQLDEIDATENLINTYLKYHNMQNRTAEQTEVMAQVAQQLKQKFGELNLAVDQNGKFYISNIGILNDKIKTMDTERDALGLVAQAERQSALDRMNIQVGLTQSTVAQAKARLEVLKQEMKALAGMAEAMTGDVPIEQEMIYLRKYGRIQTEINQIESALSKLPKVPSVSIPKTSSGGGGYTPPNIDKDKTEKENDEKVQAAEWVEGKIVDIIKKRYEQEQKLADENHKKTIEGYDKDLKEYQDYINEKLKKLDEEYAKEDYDKSLSKEKQKALDIKRQIDQLMLDSSREAQARRNDLMKALEEQNQAIADMEEGRNRDLRKQNLQDNLDEYQKKIEDLKNAEDERYEEYKAELEAKSTEAQLHLEAKRAIMNGVMLDVNGNMVSLTNAFMDFEKQFGEGLGILANQIQNEFIAKLQQAKGVIDSMGNINISTNGSVGSYADGGIVNYTGLAMVHGGQSPELMLNGSHIEGLWNFIKNIPSISTQRYTQLAGAGGMGSVALNFDNLINIDGNVDNTVIPKIEDIAEKVCERIYRKLPGYRK